MKELIAIQSQLKVPKSQKKAIFAYRSCEDILESAKPLLAAQNCVLNLCDDIVNIGTRYYVKATATLTNSSGEKATSTAYAREEDESKMMSVAQLTGSSSSYARKYALNGLFCIDDTKDDDALLSDARAKGQAAAPARQQYPATPVPNSKAPAQPTAMQSVKKPLLMADLQDDEKRIKALNWVYAAHESAANPQEFDPCKWLSERMTVGTDTMAAFRDLYAAYYQERQTF